MTTFSDLLLRYEASHLMLGTHRGEIFDEPVGYDRSPTEVPDYTLVILHAAPEPRDILPDLLDRLYFRSRSAYRLGPHETVIWINTKWTGDINAALGILTAAKRHLKDYFDDRPRLSYQKVGIRIALSIGSDAITTPNQEFFKCMDSIALDGLSRDFPLNHPVIRLDSDTTYLDPPDGIEIMARAVKNGEAHIVKAMLDFAEYRHDHRQRARLHPAERVALVYGRVRREVEKNLAPTDPRPYDEECASAFTLGDFYLKILGTDPFNRLDGENRILKARAQAAELPDIPLVKYLPDVWAGTSYRRVELLARQIPAWEIPDRNWGSDYVPFTNAPRGAERTDPITDTDVARMARQIIIGYAEAVGRDPRSLLTARQRRGLIDYIKRCRFEHDGPIVLL